MNYPPAQLVQVPFRTAALDEGVDPKQAPIGVLERLENAVWVKAGRVEKRPGTKAYSRNIIGGGTIDRRLQKAWVRGQEIAATDGDAVYSYLQNASKWRRVDAIGALQATWTTGIDSMYAIEQVDIDADANHVAMCWVSRNGSYVQVKDASGALVVPPTYVGASGLNPRILLKGATAIILYQVVEIIYAHIIDLATGSVGPQTALIVDASQLCPWDVSHDGAGLVIGYKKTNNDIMVALYSASLAAQFVDTVDSVGSNADAVSVHATTGESLYVLYTDTNDVKFAVHDPATLIQSVAPITITSGNLIAPRLAVARHDATSCVVAWVDQFALGNNEVTYTVLVTDAGVPDYTSHRSSQFARLASKPFVLAGRMYMMLSSVRPEIQVAGASITQNTTFAVEVSVASNGGDANLPHKLAAVVAPREGAAPDFTATATSAPVVGSKAYAAALYSTRVIVNDQYVAGCRLVELTTELSDPWRSVSIGNSLMMAGGVVTTYDGRKPFELSFLHAPRVISATPGTSGSMAAGKYLYAFVYEWRDATGLLYRSIPSQPVEVTVSASGSVDFLIETACTTGKTDLGTGVGDANALPCHIVPYRSTVGSPTLHRLSDVAVNNPLSTTTAFTDDRSDASMVLSTRPLLYTTGGFLDEVMPPAFLTCIMHRDRIWGVAGDRRTIWFSKAFTEDPGVFPGFHENFRVILDEDITALASLDDKLIIFSETSVWVLYGDGPTAGGVGGYDTPTVVQSDVGALSPRGVVETPDGVMFVSRRGIYLLSRQLEVRWVGREVRDQVAANPRIHDAKLVPHRNQVRFSLSSSDSSSVVLVYDYVNRFWAVFVYYTGEEGALYGPIRSMVVRGGDLYFVGGLVLMSENEDNYLDHETIWVTLALELTLLPSGPIAWQHIRRLQLLGERRSPHNLRVQLAFDHRATYSQDFTFTAEMTAVNNDSPTVRIGSQNGANPKCKALRARVTDGTPTGPGSSPMGTGQGGWFSGLGLEIIPKPGLPRHGARFAKV